MSEFNKYSTDGGATFIDVEDSNAVHWGDQSKGYVGKNLFINTGKTETINSVAFTHNSDDSVGLNNTASATAIYNVGSVKELSGINQNVILSGCPSGGSTSTYSLQIRTLTSVNVIQNGTYLIDNGNGVIFNPSGPLVDTNGNSVSISDLYINIRIGSGEDTTGKTFYPMIRLASIPDSTYEPRYMSNRELTEEIIISPTKTSALSSISSNTSKVITGHKLAIINFTGVVDTFTNWGTVVNGLPKPNADVAINVFNRTTGKQNSGVINTNGECQIVGQSSGEYPASGNAILISATYTYSSLT